MGYHGGVIIPSRQGISHIQKGGFPRIEYNVYGAFDVHARSVSAQVLVKDTDEVQKKHFKKGYTAQDIAEWSLRFSGPAYAAYESGCTGVSLCRNLRSQGVNCDAIAISSLPLLAPPKTAGKSATSLMLAPSCVRSPIRFLLIPRSGYPPNIRRRYGICVGSMIKQSAP